MIPVKLAPEPKDFNAKVRQKGLAAVDELIGGTPRLPRRGPRRAKVASTRASIPAHNFPPFWRDALDDMLAAYDRRCAFLALYIPHATGSATVDHMIPKSKKWDQVYEWSNYRLCAATINSKKSDLLGIVDPLTCKTGWFALELVGFQVVRAQTAPSSQNSAIDATLPLLNQRDCCVARETYVTDYKSGHIDIGYLQRRAPFVANELRRQSKLLPQDI